MLKINGIDYNQLHVGYQISDSITTELDSAVIILNTNEKPTFKIFDKAEFEDRDWLISIVNPELRRSMTYKTNLTLIELTYALEKYIVSPCAFTNANDKLIDQVEKLLYKVEPVFVGDEPRFRLSNRFKDFLQGKKGEDFIYSEKMTLREIIDDMVSVYGIRATVSSLNNDWSDIEIDYLDLNRKSEDIKTVERITASNEFHAAQYYADEFDISLVNAQSKDTVVSHEWQTLKPTSADIATTDNVKLVVDYPIEEIKKVRARFVVDEIVYTYRDSVTDVTHENIRYYNLDVDIDLSDLFLEQELFDSIDIKKQEDYIPYQRGSNIIGVLQSYKPFLLTYYTLEQRISTLARTYAWEYIDNNVLPPTQKVTELTVTTPSAKNIINEVLFKVEYAPYMSFDFKQSKQNSIINKGITSVVNQTDRAVDIDKYGNVAKNIANMAGNADATISVNIRSKDDLLDLGDRIENDYTLIAREYSIFNDHVKATYTFSQHFEANTSARLSRERRLYNIPEENLIDRTVILKDKLLVSTSKINGVNNGLLNDNALESIVKSFSVSPPTNKNLFLELWTKDSKNKYYPENTNFTYVLNLYGNGIGNSVIFQAKPHDNFSVGLSSSYREVGGRDVNLNPYVNDLGEFETISLNFSETNILGYDFDTQLQIGKNIPLINNAYLGTLHSKQIELQIKKDRLEIPKIVYQLGVEGSDVIIGEDFTKHIKLLNNGVRENLYIWIVNNDTYAKTDTHYCKGSSFAVPQYNENEKSIFFDPSVYLNQIKAWAIGTQSGRLILAVNNNFQNITKVYFGINRD